MAIATMLTFLVDGGLASGTKVYPTVALVEIKDYSDLEGSPNYIDVTTLSDTVAQQIPGVKQADAWEFTCNYDKATYLALKALEGAERFYSIWLGGTIAAGFDPIPAGTYGIFEVVGNLSVGITGGGVDSAVEMKVSIGKTSDVKISAIDPVTFTPIGSQLVTTANSPVDVAVVTAPTDATLTVVSSDTGVVTVAAGTQEVTLTKVGNGTAIITITATKASKITRSTTFSVTVS